MSTKPENKSTTLLRRIVARIDADRMIMDIIPLVRSHLKSLDAVINVNLAVDAIGGATDKPSTLDALDRLISATTFARDLAIENGDDPDVILGYQVLVTVTTNTRKGVLDASDADVKFRAAAINVMYGEALGHVVKPESFDIIADALAKEILPEKGADRIAALSDDEVDAALKDAYKDAHTMPNFRDPLARRVPRFTGDDLRAGKGFGQPIGKDGLARA